MTECVAVLLGTVQFHLKVNVVVPENGTLKDAEEAALAAIETAQAGHQSSLSQSTSGCSSTSAAGSTRCRPISRTSLTASCTE
jgi:hypothetical protein